MPVPNLFVLVICQTVIDQEHGHRVVDRAIHVNTFGAGEDDLRFPQADHLDREALEDFFWGHARVLTQSRVLVEVTDLHHAALTELEPGLHGQALDSVTRANPVLVRRLLVVEPTNSQISVLGQARVSELGLDPAVVVVHGLDHTLELAHKVLGADATQRVAAASGGHSDDAQVARTHMRCKRDSSHDTSHFLLLRISNLISKTPLCQSMVKSVYYGKKVCSK